jgi:hypothetical protein
MEYLTSGTEYIDGIKHLYQLIKYSSGKRVKRYFRAGSKVPVKVTTMS